MSVTIFFVFLILIQSRLTEQATEGDLVPTTEYTFITTLADNIEIKPTTESNTESITESTTEHSNFDSSYFSTNPTTDLITGQVTENSSSFSRNGEIDPFIEPVTGGTTEDSSFDSRYSSANSATESITEETTENASSYSKNTEIAPFIELITGGTTEGSNINSTTKSLPILQSMFLPADVSNERINQKSKDQSTVNVFGIVLASIISTLAVFYITMLIIKKYRKKSYIIKSPSMEMGRA